MRCQVSVNMTFILIVIVVFSNSKLEMNRYAQKSTNAFQSVCGV